jgi:carboxylesterase type B
MHAVGHRSDERRLSLINVWTPADPAANRGQSKLPVLVWVYGGSFTGGSGNITPEALARTGVIVVSFNYRVSTFGFIAHPQLTSESFAGVSGNYGLFDAMAALRWIRDNIDAFGGDPNSITLFGQSAGASVITLLQISPLAKGLYQKVILESPGSMRHMKNLEQSAALGLTLGPDIGALRALPANQIPLIQNLGGGTAIRALFQPRIIGGTQDGCVVPTEEREAFESGNMNVTPLLVGSNTNEGISFTGNYLVTTIPAYINYLNDPIIFGPYGGRALQLYPVVNDSEVRRAVADSFADSQFHFGTRGVARAMSEHEPNVYRYFFSRRASGTGADPVHGAELDYVFGRVTNSAPYNTQDVALSAAMMEAWKKFAITGNPNGGAITNWPRYDARTDPILILGDTFDTVGFGIGRSNIHLDFIGEVLAATKGPSTATSKKIQSQCTCEHQNKNKHLNGGFHPFGAVCEGTKH